MLERSAALQSLATRLRAYRTAAAPHIARAWEVTKLWSEQTWAFAKLAARKAAALTKRATLAALLAAEKTLLSASGRERVHATAVFTLIFAFAVTSVDFLLTGGPELSPGATAAPYSAQANLIAARSPRPAAELAFAAPVDTALIDEAALEDAVVTPLSAAAPDHALIDAPNPTKAEIERTQADEPDHAKAKPESERT